MRDDSEFKKAYLNIIKESPDLAADLNKREQLEKLIKTFDPKLQNEEWTVCIGKGDGSYNYPLHIFINKQKKSKFFSSILEPLN